MPVSWMPTSKIRVCHGDKVWIRPDKAQLIAKRSVPAKDESWVITLIEQEREPYDVLLNLTSPLTGKLSVMFYGTTLSVYDSEIIRA